MKIFVLLGAMGFLKSLSAQSRVVATVTNFKNDNGVCKACLFNNAAAFKGKGDAVACINFPVKNKEALVTFNNVPPGTYAISVYHDANKNEKIDLNFLGAPKEGYGASLNKLPFASAPTFDENKFAVGNNVTVSMNIKLRNL